jgi:hypothetical protein
VTTYKWIVGSYSIMNTRIATVFGITGVIAAILLFAVGPIVMHQALACDGGGCGGYTYGGSGFYNYGGSGFYHSSGSGWGGW